MKALSLATAFDFAAVDEAATRVRVLRHHAGIHRGFAALSPKGHPARVAHMAEVARLDKQADVIEGSRPNAGC